MATIDLAGPARSKGSHEFVREIRATINSRTNYYMIELLINNWLYYYHHIIIIITF